MLGDGLVRVTARPLGRQRADKRADVERQLHQHQVHARIHAQPGQGGAFVVRLLQLGAAGRRDPRRLAQLAAKLADDENLHRVLPSPIRS